MILKQDAYVLHIECTKPMLELCFFNLIFSHKPLNSTEPSTERTKSESATFSRLLFTLLFTECEWSANCVTGMCINFVILKMYKLVVLLDSNLLESQLLEHPEKIHVHSNPFHFWSATIWNHCGQDAVGPEPRSNKWHKISCASTPSFVAASSFVADFRPKDQKQLNLTELFDRGQTEEVSTSHWPEQ